MKRYIYCFYFLLIFCASNAQNSTTWEQIEQATIGLTYQIPNNWYLMSFVQDKIGDCEGGTLNTSPDGTINMVILYDEAAALSRLRKVTIWENFTLKMANVQDIIQTKDFFFQKTISTWEEDNEALVHQYIGVSAERAYVIYFWGNRDAMDNNMDVINRIISTMNLFAKN